MGRTCRSLSRKAMALPNSGMGRGFRVKPSGAAERLTPAVLLYDPGSRLADSQALSSPETGIFGDLKPMAIQALSSLAKNESDCRLLLGMSLPSTVPWGRSLVMVLSSGE